MFNVICAGALTILAAYLIGSIDFAIIVCRMMKGEDIRNSGSGNAGMTNVLRTYGFVPAFFTLIGDFGKGIAAIELGRLIFDEFGIISIDGEYIAGLFVLLGHMFPIYFGFRGGKGVLTNLGIMLMINVKVFVITLLVMGLVIVVTRMMSAGSVAGAVVYPIITGIELFLSPKPVVWNVVFATLFSLLVIFKHRNNIKSIINGTERKLWKTKKEKNNEK